MQSLIHNNREHLLNLLDIKSRNIHIIENQISLYAPSEIPIHMLNNLKLLNADLLQIQNELLSLENYCSTGISNQISKINIVQKCKMDEELQQTMLERKTNPERKKWLIKSFKDLGKNVAMIFRDILVKVISESTINLFFPNT